MNAGRKIEGRWQEETTCNQCPFSGFIYVGKNTIQGNMTEESEKIKVQTVNIIITPAENIEYGK